MKKISTLFVLSVLLLSCRTSNNKAATSSQSPKPLNWNCSEFLHKPASSVQSILGKPSDCYNCTETSGELQYYNAVADAMGSEQTLKIHYYEGVVTWLQYGSSMTYTEDGRACR